MLLLRASLVGIMLVIASAGCDDREPIGPGPVAGAGGQTDAGGPIADGTALAPDSTGTTTCPGWASDESCPAGCLKEWGTGASPCVAPCTKDSDCQTATSPKARCHSTGYCSTSCTSDSDCSSGWDPYTCDPTEKLCNYCENCT